MRAAIYNPYLDTLGGGERYTMAFANTLVKKGYEVDVEWKSDDIRSELEKRFNILLDNLNFVRDVKKGEGYDVLFWVSDGSVPLLHARNNILHFQVPFKNVSGKSLLNRMKLFRINKIVCNSKFTKRVIDAEFGTKSLVIYPPVGIEKIKTKKKENLILYVGRFSKLLQSKRQDILMESFKMFYKKGYKDWKLVLAGGTEVGADDLVKNLIKSASKYPIKIIESPSFNEIKDLFGKARFFWSASGHGIDEIKEPSKVEHFGITVVEAMAGGAVPLVYNAGGHKEIVNDAENGFLWNTENELVTKTIKLLKDPKMFSEMSKNAVRSSTAYGYDRFEKEVNSII